MVKAGIVGASGYAGGELLRLLLGHPEIEVTQITSETYAGQFAYFVHPNLRGHTTLKFTRMADVEPCDLLFLGLPHGHVMKRIEELAGITERIIDLSADFRLHTSADYEKWYDHAHPHPDWLDKFIYGLPELHREEMRDAKYISGVGCNASVTILGLWPLHRRGLVRETIVEIKAGSSEGGNKPSAHSHHPERAGVVRTYMPKGHRHIAEIIQELALDLQEPKLHFSVTSVGTVRGATATCHCLLKEDLEEKEAWKFYREDYGDEPFVRLVRSKRGLYRYPEAKFLTGSNHCDIGFEADPEGKRLVVISVIDNLMKGAAGSAVQSMNVMYGWPETLGLEFPGLHPI
jgi:N-acetyl-gamma-glutamyl-phosphate/LysW-gamma-L-alpha-aminoadipyl-6-phosphate reductase